MLPGLLALLLTVDGGPAPPTARTWRDHPQVVAAREVFTEVRALLDAGKLSTRDVTACEAFSEFSLSTDAKGTVRLFVRRFGSEDSSHRVDAYYDDAGRLRFVFVRVGAVPSAWVEARWWLDEAGAVIWKSRASGGEGPTYYANDFAEYRVLNPLEYVAKHSTCPEK